MHELIQLIQAYGLPVVFGGVLLESLGLPLPAMLLLVVAGGYAAGDPARCAQLVASAIAACLIGEVIWFAAGLRFGHRVLKTLCRISISPDSCVRQTESFYDRWGPRVLIVARFIPGLATVASPLAGAMGLPLATFLYYSTLGAAIWVGSSVGVGFLFQAQIEVAGDYLLRLGSTALYAVAILFAAYLAVKWWERRRFFRTLRMARITAQELQAMFNTDTRPVVLDVRSEAARKADTRKVPGAIFVDMETADQPLAHLAPDTEVIVYCTCPSEASAARVARYLMDRGFDRVRPLAGGLDAWYAQAPSG